MILDKNIRMRNNTPKIADLLKKYHDVHGDKYTYEKAVYLSTSTEMIITCPVHGDFLQKPDYHRSGKGCRKCGNKLKGAHQKLTNDEFIRRSKKVHEDLYDYSKTVYTGRDNDVVIICPIHGEYTQNANSHMQGYSCKKCGEQRSSDAKRLSQSEFLRRVKANGRNWLYHKTVYKSAREKIILTCPVHGDKKVSAASAIQGTGCNECNHDRGFKFTKPATLYYLSINDGQTYKIGITNISIKARFKQDSSTTIKVLGQLQFKSGEACYRVEQALLRMFQSSRYVGPPILKTGNTELFRKDILPAFRNIQKGS